MTQTPSLKAWGLLIMLSLIWGSSFILIKKGLLGLTSFEVGSLRILSASLVMVPFVIRGFRQVERHQIKYLLSVGLLGSFVPAFLFAIAQTRLESSITGVLNAMTPIFTMLVGLVVYRQKQSPRVFLGVVVGFVGAAVLVMSGSGGDISNFNFYALFVVLATILYAFNANIIKYHLQGLRSLTITSISLALVGPAAAVHLFFFSDFPVRFITDEAVMLAGIHIIVLGVVGTAIALIIFNKLVNLTDPVFTSSVTYIIPIVAVSWGLLDGEVLLMSDVVGIMAIFTGVYIANSFRRKA